MFQQVAVVLFAIIGLTLSRNYLGPEFNVPPPIMQPRSLSSKFVVYLPLMMLAVCASLIVKRL